VLLCTLGLLVINAVSLEVGSLEGESTLLGCLLILISLIPEAAYYILNKFHPIRLPVFLLSALMNGVNMLIMVPLAFFQLKGDFPVISLMQWMILGLLSLSSAVFYVCWYKGSEHIEASRAALSTAAMPIATLIISFIFLHEALTPMQWIGMVLIVLSIILSSKTAKKCQPPA
jgi:drug/metabolite transporter (DMT)-like permease